MGGATDVAEGDEDDPCRSEGIVRFVIPNFSKLSEQILSGPTYIRNLPWLVYMRGWNTVNCKYFVPKIFRTINFCVK